MFCVSMVTSPQSAQDNNESSRRPPEQRASAAFELPWHLEELHNLTFTLRMRPTPVISGLLRAAKIGLAGKGMTHGMTKLLCVSVRLGLYPTDICWLRLIQAPEKPGIRVRHRWLSSPPPPTSIPKRKKKCFYCLFETQLPLQTWGESFSSA